MNRNLISVRLLAIICLFFCISESMVQAEGSRSLYPATYPAGGSRADLDFQPPNKYVDRVIRRGFTYVYAQAGEYITLGSSNCGITNSKAWSLVRGGLGAPPNSAYAVPASPNRVLVVAVSSRLAAAGLQTPTVTYGGQPLILQVGDGATSAMQHSYLFYLNDAGIVSAVGTNLVFTGLGGAATYNHVYAAVYTGVDQATPITNSQNSNSLAVVDTAVGPFAPALTIAAGDLAVEIVNLTKNDNAAPARTISTWAANWASVIGPNSFNTDLRVSAYIATNTTAGTTTSQHTASGNCYDSMSAMTLKQADNTASGEIYVFNPQDFGVPGDETIPAWATADFTRSGGPKSLAPGSYFGGKTGQIRSRAQELAGPKSADGTTGGVNTFVPCAYLAPVDGIYGVVFTPILPWGTTGPTGSIGNPLTSDSGTACWDVTVRADATSTANLDGRIFTYAFLGYTGGNQRRVYSSLYYITSDAYRYRQDLRGLDPNGYALYANSLGFLDNGKPIYKDLRGSNAYLSNLPVGVTTQRAEYPIFFSDVTPGGVNDAQVSLVLNALSIPLVPVSPTVSAISFSGNLGGAISTTGAGGTFQFSTTDTITYMIVVSLDGLDFSPQTLANATLTGIAGSGTHVVTWGGKDNAGNIFPSGGPYTYRVFGRNAEIHFPIIDAENNNDGTAAGGGPTISRLNGPGFPDNTAFFDDRGYVSASGTLVGATLSTTLCTNGNPPTVNVNLDGVDSSTNYHQFGVTAGTNNTNADCTSTTSWGDAKGLNLWTYFSTAPQTSDLSIVSVTYDVGTTVSATATAVPGDPVAGTFAFSNYGSNTANGITYGMAFTGVLPAAVNFQNLPAGVTAAYAPGTGVVTFGGAGLLALFTLAPGQTWVGATDPLAPITFTYTAPATGPVIVTTAITTTDTDSVLANNTSTATTGIGGVDVATAVFVPAVAQIGSTVEGSFSFSNFGENSADNVTYSVTIGSPGHYPASVSFASGLPIGVTAVYNPVDGQVTFTGMPTILASGQFLNFNFTYPAPGLGIVPIVTAITTTSGDANPANNNANGNTNILSIDAVDDDLSGGPVNGFTGGPTATVYTNDRLVGVPFLPGDVVPSIANPGLLTGVTINPADGTLIVPAGTPAGTYTVTYQICNVLIPANCDTANAIVQVNPPVIDAVTNDFSGTPINGFSGGTTATVYNNDTLNGAAFSPGAVTPIITAEGGLTGVSINPADGTLIVPAGRPAGTYTVTYQICENLNPTNCDTADVTVVLTAAVIDAVNDDFTGTPVNGFTGGTTPTVFTNDTLNGLAFLPTAVTAVITPGGDGGLTGLVINADGTLTVPGGFPAGTYTVTYQICEVLNPTNCDTATATVVLKTIDAVNDDFSGTPINGFTGGTTATVYTNDTLNGAAFLPGDVTPTITLDGGLTGVGINPLDGTLTIPPGSPAGTYTVTYQICENPALTNCDTATVTVTVNPPVIDAVLDDFSATAVSSVTGGTTPTVFTNDTLNGLGFLPASVTAIITPGGDGGLTGLVINADGTLTVPGGFPAGTYTVTYQICEVLNPTNCDTAIATVVLKTIVAVNDDFSGTPINPAGGASPTVFTNDTLNGLAFLPADVTAIITPGGDGGLTGLVINADGTLTVPGGFPAGTYTVTYQICEVLNPTNCDTATAAVVIAAATGTISGTVFNDINRDGIQNFGELGIPGVTITLSNGSTATTIANGTYSFAGVPAGAYTVTETNPTGYISTTPDVVTVILPAGGTATANFGDRQQAAPRRAIKFENPSCTACSNTCPDGHFNCSIQDSPSLGLTTDGTIEAWIQATSCTASDADAGIVVKGDGTNFSYGFGLSGAPGGLFPGGTPQNIGFRVGNNVLVAASQTLQAGKWYHVACAWSGGLMSIYINGVLEAGPAAGIPVGASAAPIAADLLLGVKSTTAPYGQYLGMMEEFRLWNTARTVVPIRDNMCKALTLPDANLACYLQFNEDSGLPVDFSANGNIVGSNAFSVCSEAPVGESSVHKYFDELPPLYLVSITAGSDTLTADQFGGSWGVGDKSGIQMYRVDDAPEPSNGPMGSKLFGARGLWGVFITGAADATYYVKYTYGLDGIGDETNLRLMYRHQGCAPWIDLEAAQDSTIDPLILPVLADTLIKTGLSGTEFILGSLVDPRNTIEFDGTSRYVDVLDDTSLDSTTAGTLEAWVYLPAAPTPLIPNAGIINKGDTTDGYRLTTDALGDKVVFTLYDSGGPAPFFDSVTSAALNLATWYHVAATWDGTNMNLYINGILDPGSKASVHVSGNPTGTNLTIGRDDTPIYFKGYIDEVRVWKDVALPVGTIQDWMCKKLIYKNPPAVLSGHPNWDGSLGGKNNLGGYWRFDEEPTLLPILATCQDDTANNNDGTMTGFAATIEAARIPSSAPIGDYSAFNYMAAAGLPSVTLNPAPSRGSFQATATGGPWAANFGIHVYRLDEAPVYPPHLWNLLSLTPPLGVYPYTSPNGLTPPVGWSSIDYYRYFGVFVTNPTGGLTYDVVYDYTNNPLRPDDDSQVRLARRPAYWFDTWTDTLVTPPVIRPPYTLTYSDTQNTALAPAVTGNKQNPEYILGGDDAPLAIILASFTATASDGCVDVAWETATEINTAGFNVWRSDNPLTGFVRVNNGMVPSNSLAETMGAKYTFRDCGVDFTGGKTYYYILEEIEIDGDGSGNMHGPIGPVSETISAAQSTSGSNGSNCFIDSLGWW